MMHHDAGHKKGTTLEPQALHSQKRAAGAHMRGTQPRGNKYKNRYLSRKRLQPGRADTYPHRIFFPGLVHLFPSGADKREMLLREQHVNQ
jgi:hypothetical protein